jgi:hypothetical protein
MLQVGATGIEGGLTEMFVTSETAEDRQTASTTIF